MSGSPTAQLDSLDIPFDEFDSGCTQSSSSDVVLPGVLSHQVIDSAPETAARPPIQIQSAREQHNPSATPLFVQYLSLLASKTLVKNGQKWSANKSNGAESGTTLVQIEGNPATDDHIMEKARDVESRKKKSRLRSALKRMAKESRKNPNREALIAALKRKLRNQYSSEDGAFWERCNDNAFIASVYMFDACSPSSKRNHLVWVTPIFITLTMVLFGFMAGAYPLYQQANGNTDEYHSLGWGPKELSHSITRRDRSAKFDFGFLLTWGGRYLPSIQQGESYRWFTSLLLHQSFIHLLSNVLIFLIVGTHLEMSYGGVRILWVAFLSGLGGNFLSALLEDKCSMVVGSSGIVFGLIGFGLMDVVLNQNLQLKKIWRLLITVAFIFFFMLTVLLEEYSSHVSHVGGIVCGVVSSLVFLESLKYERIEGAVVWLILGFQLVYFLILPLVLYNGVLPNLSCTKLDL